MDLAGTDRAAGRPRRCERICRTLPHSIRRTADDGRDEENNLGEEGRGKEKVLGEEGECDECGKENVFEKEKVIRPMHDTSVFRVRKYATYSFYIFQIQT